MTQIVVFRGNIMDERLKIATMSVFEALFQAIEDGNNEMLEWYLFPPEKFWRVDPDIILSVAIQNHNIEAVKLLLQFGANPNAKNQYGKSILDLAYTSNVGIDIFRELCFYGLNDYELKKHGVFLLYMAVRNSDVVLLRELIRLGVSVCSRFGAIHSPLILAAENNRVDIFMLLLDAGADLSVDVIRWCIGKNCIMQAIADLKVIDKRNNLGRRALENVVLDESVKLIPELLKYGAKIDGRNKFGDTALHLAACYNCVVSIEELLKHGAQLNAKNNRGLTPLKLALAFKAKESAQLLTSKIWICKWNHLIKILKLIFQITVVGAIAVGWIAFVIIRIF